MKPEAIVTSGVVGVVVAGSLGGVILKIEDGFFLSTIIGGHNHVHQCTILIHGEDMKREGEKIVVDKIDHDSFLLECKKCKATMRLYKLPSCTVPSW